MNLGYNNSQYYDYTQMPQFMVQQQIPPNYTSFNSTAPLQDSQKLFQQPYLPQIPNNLGFQDQFISTPVFSTINQLNYEYVPPMGDMMKQPYTGITLFNNPSMDCAQIQYQSKIQGIPYSNNRIGFMNQENSAYNMIQPQMMPNQSYPSNFQPQPQPQMARVMHENWEQQQPYPTNQTTANPQRFDYFEDDRSDIAPQDKYTENFSKKQVVDLMENQKVNSDPQMNHNRYLDSPQLPEESIIASIRNSKLNAMAQKSQNTKSSGTSQIQNTAATNTNAIQTANVASTANKAASTTNGGISLFKNQSNKEAIKYDSNTNEEQPVVSTPPAKEPEKGTTPQEEKEVKSNQSPAKAEKKKKFVKQYIKKERDPTKCQKCKAPLKQSKLKTGLCRSCYLQKINQKKMAKLNQQQANAAQTEKLSPKEITNARSKGNAKLENNTSVAETKANEKKEKLKVKVKDIELIPIQSVFEIKGKETQIGSECQVPIPTFCLPKQQYTEEKKISESQLSNRLIYKGTEDQSKYENLHQKLKLILGQSCTNNDLHSMLSSKKYKIDEMIKKLDANDKDFIVYLRQHSASYCQRRTRTKSKKLEYLNQG